jgi:hypothetical protein
MKIPEEMNLEELKKLKKENSEERIRFVEKYAEWVKKTPNKIWSKQQKNLESK